MTSRTSDREPGSPAVPVLGVVALVACAAYIGSFAVLSGSTPRESMSSPLTVTVNMLATLGFAGLALAVPGLLRRLGMPRWVGPAAALALAGVGAMAWSLATVVPGLADLVSDQAFEDASAEPLVLLVGAPKMALGLVAFGAVGVLGWRRRLMPRALAGLFVVAGLAALIWPYPPGGLLVAVALLWLDRVARSVDRGGVPLRVPPRRQFAHRTMVAFVAGAVAAAVLVSASVSLASIPSAGGTITSCVSKRSGAVRIIDVAAGKRCTTSERKVSWFQGPVVRVYGVPRTPFAVDRHMNRVGSLTLPRAGTWTLAATSVVYVNLRYPDGVPRFAGSLYAACQLRGPGGRFLGGTDATTLTDRLGNGFASLSFNGVVTVTSASRTLTLWCRADDNSPSSSTTAASTGAQVLATRVAGLA